jgi:hypothetical protein
MGKPPLPYRDEILRALGRIAAPQQVVELRSLRVAGSTGGRPVTLRSYFDDLELLAAAAANLW